MVTKRKNNGDNRTVNNITRIIQKGKLRKKNSVLPQFQKSRDNTKKIPNTKNQNQ